MTNGLAAIAPEIAAEWHPTRNGSLLPQEVFAAADRQVWWCCPVGHTWRATVRDRTTRRRACQVCAHGGR